MKKNDSKKDIIIIEPHCDDAFLSLGWHIEKWKKDFNITIITVFCNPKRAIEAANYAKSLDINSIVIKPFLQETEMLGEYTINTINPILNYLVDNCLYNKKYNIQTILCPIGLQHPDHKNIRFTLDSGLIKSKELVQYYLDTPYQSKQKLAGELLENVKGYVIESILYPNARKWRHCVTFKSQAKFFHFNKELKESILPEIIIRSINVNNDTN